MCTLLIRHNPVDPNPLALLTNRDEAYDRPSEGWAWRDGTPPYFAPRDKRSGGTWIGLNEHGVVAALTNIFPNQKSGTYRSRGALVTDMLALGQADKAQDALEAAVSEADYNNFNLLVADAHEAHLFMWQHAQLKAFNLNPGSYRVGNDPFDGGSQPLDGRANEVWFDEESATLAQHPQICKHGEKYGTRCSHRLLIHRDGIAQSEVWHLDGHPCEGQFARVLDSIKQATA